MPLIPQVRPFVFERPAALNRPRSALDDRLWESAGPLIFVQEGGLLYRQGDSPRAAFLIQSGLVKVRREGADGRSRVVRLEGPDALAGAASLLTLSEHDDTAEAAERCGLRIVDAALMRRWQAAEPRLLEHVYQAVCERLLEQRKRAQDRCSRSARARLADILLELDGFGEGRPGRELPISPPELAQLSGVSRETASRLLSLYRRQGVIELGNQRLRVLKPQLLREHTGPAY